MRSLYQEDMERLRAKAAAAHEYDRARAKERRQMVLIRLFVTGIESSLVYIVVHFIVKYW